MRNYLEFEKEVKSLEDNLESSKNPFDKDGISEVNTEKIETIQKEINEKLDGIYSNLNSWQKTLVARHEDRPRANFYVNKIVSDFTQLSGDRLFGEDRSIIAGLGFIIKAVKLDKFPSDGLTHSIFAKGSGRQVTQIMATDWPGHRQQLYFRRLEMNWEGTLSKTPFSELQEAEYMHLACSYDGEKFTTFINGELENNLEPPVDSIGLISGGMRFGEGADNIGING